MERREILQGERFTDVQAKQIFTSIRSMDYFVSPLPLPLAISNGWRTSEKKKRKKRKKKLRDVQCLNHSDRRVIAPAKEEINRDLIARIFGFTAIPRVTRFKRFSIVRLSRCLTGKGYSISLSRALSVSNSTCRETIRAEHDGQPDFPDEFRRRR